MTPLHLASQRGHLDVVKYLVIEQQIDPLCEDEYGNTPFHRACAGGCQAVVEFQTHYLLYCPILVCVILNILFKIFIEKCKKLSKIL